jgi:hypothetical protein
MTSAETIEKVIVNLEKYLAAKQPHDDEIIAKYLHYQAKYEELVTEGNYSIDYYIKKEAYRRLANKRGYDDEALRAERNRK